MAMEAPIAKWERERAAFGVEGDILVTNHGSIFTFRPLNSEAGAWLAENTDEDAQFFGHALVVEPRYALDLADALMDDGFVLR